MKIMNVYREFLNKILEKELNNIIYIYVTILKSKSSLTNKSKTFKNYKNPMEKRENSQKGKTTFLLIDIKPHQYSEKNTINIKTKVRNIFARTVLVKFKKSGSIKY